MCYHLHFVLSIYDQSGFSLLSHYSIWTVQMQKRTWKFCTEINVTKTKKLSAVAFPPVQLTFGVVSIALHDMVAGMKMVILFLRQDFCDYGFSIGLVFTSVHVLHKFCRLFTLTISYGKQHLCEHSAHHQTYFVCTIWCIVYTATQLLLHEYIICWLCRK